MSLTLSCRYDAGTRSRQHLWVLRNARVGRNPVPSSKRQRRLIQNDILNYSGQAFFREKH